MDAWIIWLIAAVVFAIGEIATTSFFLGPFAIGPRLVQAAVNTFDEHLTPAALQLFLEQLPAQLFVGQA